MSTLLQDLRYAVRVLFRSKIFSLAIISTLGLAIGANTAAFSIMNAVLFPDLLYKDPARLISIRENGRPEINFANYDQRLKDFDFFESIGGHRIIVHYLTGNGEAKRIVGWHVTPGFLATLGAPLLLGRNFLPEEDLPGAPLTVILSEDLWSTQFSRDPHVIGKSVRMNGQPYEVIGVMPKNFRHTSPGIGPPCWTSLGADFQRLKKAHYRVFLVARLKPDMTIEQAQARVNAVAAGWKAGPDFKLVVEPLGNPTRGYEHFGESGFLIFCVAVIFVLLIACANIMNLLLARGMTREKEIALRIALGADRSRLIRQFLTETTLLCVLGGGIGLLLTFVFRDAIFRYGSQVVWILHEIPINKNVVLFTAGASVFAALFTGLLPAMQSSRVDLHASLKEGGQRSGRGHRGDRFRSFLVVFQVALSLMLLIGSGLMLKSFQQIQKVDLGYDPKGLFTVSVELPSYKYADEAQKKNFYKSLLRRLHDVPYLQQIGVTTRLPWDVGGSAGVTTDEGRYSEQGIDYSSVSPAYLRTLGVMLLQGRHFTQRDEDQPLVIINWTAAKKFWPDKQAIGRRIKVDFEGSPQYEVVGVIKDINASSGLPDAPHIYFARTEGYWRWLSIVVRSNVPKEEVVAALKNAIRSVDKEVPLALDSVQFTELLSEVLQRRRMILILVTFFAGVAICLAAVGTYALVDYSTSRMHHEIGVRISVGARRNDILGLILKYGMRLAVAGIAVGLLLCLSLNRFLQSYLYGISSTDWGTYVSVSFLLIVVTLLACLIPARRAASLDPADVLRSE